MVEPGSREVAAVFRGRGEVAVSRLAHVEVASALARRAREGDVGDDDARRLTEQLRDDLAELRVVEVRPAIVDEAAELVGRRALRAYDALQLASALRLAGGTGLAVTFWCSDTALIEAARREGLRTRRV